MKLCSITGLLLCLCMAPLHILGLPRRLRWREQTKEEDEFLKEYGARNYDICSFPLFAVTIRLTLDANPEQTSWALSEQSGGANKASSSGTYNNGTTTVQTHACVADGCYTFTIRDTAGDGICCASGSGSYNVSSSGTILASGGSFTSSESTNFCLGVTSEADPVESTPAEPEVVTTAKPGVPTQVTIIGAGAAGLSAAYTLERNGLDFIILEASNGFGGRVQKDTTFTDGSFPLDLGASFIQFPDAIHEIIGRDDLMGEVTGPGAFSFVSFVNYTYYDFFSDYIAPKDVSKIQYGCRVQSVNYVDDKLVSTACEDGGTFLSHSTIVTVPLSILKAGEIDFSPPLPESLTVGHPGEMWGGFKIIIEFETDFLSSAFCSGICYNEDGESYFWDITEINERLPTNNTIVMGYICGPPAIHRSFSLNDDDIWLQVMRPMLDDKFGNQTSASYVKHMVINWSKNPNINGTYSSRAYGEPGAQNVRDRVWVAGEAFPIENSEFGWVDAGAFSGDDAAKQILNLKVGIDFDDKATFWDTVAEDLGRGG